MRKWFSKSSNSPRGKESATPPSTDKPTTTAPATPPPLPLRLGVPPHACALAVDPLQGAIAVGGSYGDVQIFSGRSGAELRLPKPAMTETKPFTPTVMNLLWDVNAGRLLVVHAPNLVKIWSFAQGRATLTATFRAGAGKSAVTAATMVPRSGGLALFGSMDLKITACDASTGTLSSWSLDMSEWGSEPSGGGFCALEMRPADPSLRLLVGVQAGALRVFKLASSAGGAGGTTTSPEQKPPLVFAEHSAGAPLSCAVWLCDGAAADGVSGLIGGGGGGGFAAGYANGDVSLFSLRSTEAPTAVLRLGSSLGKPPGGVGGPAAADAEAAEFEEATAAQSASGRRGVRWLHCIGGGSGGASSSGGGAAATSPVLLVAGGTDQDAHEPDGLVVLRGAGFRERSLLAPPNGGAVLMAAATCSSTQAQLMPNGSPAIPGILHVLSASGELFRYSLRVMGAAPKRHPDGVNVDVGKGGQPRVRLAVTPCGGDRVLAHLSVGTPMALDQIATSRSATPTSPRAADTPPPDERPAARALRLAAEAMAETDDLPAATPFFDPSVEWSEASGSAEGVLGAASQRLGTQEEGSLGRWLGDGLQWASSQVAKHQEAQRAAPVENLRRVLFPPSATPVDVSDARGVGAADEDAKRAALLGTCTSEQLRGLSTRERVEARKAAHRAAKGGASSSSDKVAGAKGAMSESLEAMHQRGQKLSELGDKTQSLADDAEDFASLAKQLRKQSEKGIFGGLF